MAEEPQHLSIQQRIAALKQAQANHTSNGAEPPVPRPQPPPTPGRTNAANNPPCNGVAPNGNQPSGQKPGTLPPPSWDKLKGKAPPPLPSRKTSERPQPPPLPRREISFDPHRRSSIESAASDASYKTAATCPGRITTGSRASTDSVAHPVRAPAYGDTNLPPLPPRRENTKDVKLPARPKPPSTKSTESLRPPPSLPHRRDSSNSPGRPVPVPPRTPSRDQGQAQITNGESNKPSGRKLPPPPPSPAGVEKIQQAGFARLNKGGEVCDTNQNSVPNGVSQEAEPSPVPPPVPLASRPDLSKLQATKPRMNGSNGWTAPSTSVVCLKCRDYSAADSHASRFPRESLPSHDLGWLANELTGPFPSHTDKARVLFTWLHHNIEYDVRSFFGNNVKSSTPNSTLATGLAVCEGYAQLFAALARHAGMEAVVISGHGKGFGYQELAPGSSLPPYQGNHAWNAVKIDNGQWKLIDATWGAGVVQGAGQPYLKRFEPAMFTNTNDELGLKHFPANRDQFFRDDGRPWISWEEYLLGNPNSSLGAEQPTVFDDARKHSIGEGTFLPATKRISINQPGPIRFQFGLICEHWTLERHSRTLPGLFLLMIHGIDGREEDRIPMNHVRGRGAGGGGDLWYVDVADARILGTPGQTAQIAVLTSFGDHKDARGVTVQEYREKAGRVGMAWAYIAAWELVA